MSNGTGKKGVEPSRGPPDNTEERALAAQISFAKRRTLKEGGGPSKGGATIF